MTEKYLHYIWRTQRFDVAALNTSKGEEIVVKSIGTYNENESGPDFKFGAIKMDQVDLHGHIEIHIKSSDWYRHNHHIDANYNNVILHVVYENDLEVIQNGVEIPTIELKNHIDSSYVKQSIESYRFHSFPCEKMINTIDSIYMEQMKSSAIVEKLNRKVIILKQLNLKSNASAFYYLLGTSFGMSVNGLGFDQLLKSVPYESFIRIGAEQRGKLLLSESGAMFPKNNIWHKKGTRPSNFPTKRILEFSKIASHFNFEMEYLEMGAREILLNFQSVIRAICEVDSTFRISTNFLNSLVINSLTPYLWFLADQKEEDKFREISIDILSMLPAEKNRIIKRWIEIGVGASNAFDTQSLLALNRYYCCRKKCLSCAVGKKVLE